eukprot:TRINITY_DN65536_c0_g1_i1.p1 TRINITY_DN65536_c0_g1~~TRINITY_DN65536_c0_g1_i1.p1  ORF type:complete len:306 (+),score=92.18 TRINITY_DN65536_c0_g1_i1:81-920(+)
MASPRLGFLGGGAMGSAIIKGVIAAGIVRDPATVVVADPHAPAREALGKATGASTVAAAPEVLDRCDVIFVCVKPHIVPQLMEQIKARVDPGRHLFVSIAAGVTTDTFSALLAPKAARLVRVMPNTACLVGASASSIFPNKLATEPDVDLVLRIFRGVGLAVRLPEERLLDAATGVAGSGIAFVYLQIEAMADGAVRAGLPRPVALQLAAQTVLGGAKMALAEGAAHPGALKDAVCSPGGTTIEGVAALERGAFRSTLIEAVSAAANKATALGAPKPKL